ncbi:MAG TPA: aldo/keto reductase [Lacibacter sp.]|nr:aldo/keto reductase [Lacibacter sp.]HMO89472.1 aldo/keto reductase [Lacibacter sp.]HMP86855.1 aldo/keto reductase [Lacibacter sp.]
MTYSRIIAGTMKWGAWGARFSTGDYDRMIRHCLDQGVTTFDHADIYGDYTTEAEFGAVLRQDPSLRSRMQLITKCGIRKVSANRPHHKIKSYNTSANHIIESVETSLDNLHTDTIDCLLLHRPDMLLDADEVAGAITKLQEQGKILRFGVSNFKRWQVELLHSRVPLTTNQVQCSVLHLDPFTDGTLDQCQQLQLVPMAWSPLGGGNLFQEREDERHQRITAVASLLAEEYGTGPDIILLSWLLSHPARIHPLLGTTRPERVEAALEATRFQLTREQWFMLWRASTGKEVA